MYKRGYTVGAHATISSNWGGKLSHKEVVIDYMMPAQCETGWMCRVVDLKLKPITNANGDPLMLDCNWLHPTGQLHYDLWDDDIPF